MAYQFIHIETYSEARTKVKGTTDHYNSAAQVLGEAMRESAKVIARDLCQAERAVQHADTIRETYQQKAAALSAEKAEFDEGVKAIETLVTQLETGQATVSNGTVQMQDPPGFIQRLFQQNSDETRSTGIFRRLFRLIVRGTGTTKMDGQTLEP